MVPISKVELEVSPEGGRPAEGMEVRVGVEVDGFRKMGVYDCVDLREIMEDGMATWLKPNG